MLTRLRERFYRWRRNRSAVGARHRYYKHPKIAEAVWATTPTPKRLCLFAHYHPQGAVTDRVRFYLEALKATGMETVLVTTSPSFPDGSQKRIEGLVRSYLHRHNWGMDFGSWQLVIQAMLADGSLAHVDELTLANDSVLGPVFSLAKVFETMATVPADLWGITESEEIRPHLQSYFLVFRAPILRSAFFADFWNAPIEQPSRSWVIEHGELALTERAQRAGFKTAAFCPWARVLEASEETRAGQNPTHAYFDVLLRDRLSPFVKMDILRKNPKLLGPMAEHFVPPPLRLALERELR